MGLWKAGESSREAASPGCLDAQGTWLCCVGITDDSSGKWFLFCPFFMNILERYLRCLRIFTSVWLIPFLPQIRLFLGGSKNEDEARCRVCWITTKIAKGVCARMCTRTYVFVHAWLCVRVNVHVRKQAKPHTGRYHVVTSCTTYELFRFLYF